MTKLWHRDAWRNGLLDSELSGRAKLLGVVHARHARDQRGRPGPVADLSQLGYELMMEQASIGKRAHIAAANRELAEAGWLELVRPAGQHRSAIYRLAVPPSRSHVGTADVPYWEEAAGEDWDESAVDKPLSDSRVGTAEGTAETSSRSQTDPQPFPQVQFVHIQPFPRGNAVVEVLGIKDVPPYPPHDRARPPDVTPQGRGEEIPEEQPPDPRHALVAEIRQLRPDWSRQSIAAALTHPDATDRGPWPLIAQAMRQCARDPTTQHPGRLAYDGPWWRDARLLAPPEPVPKPDHCGACDISRQIELVDGRMVRCPDCHPHGEALPAHLAHLLRRTDPAATMAALEARLDLELAT